MIKRFAIKKIVIITLSFVFLLIIYLFPKNEKYSIHSTLSYITPETMPIYLVDNNNNMVSRFEIIKKSENINELIEEIIKNLTIGDTDNNIPERFKKIIPKGTKIISKDLKNGILKINFTKELLNITKDNEEKMLETIIYSLTEVKDIKKIMIFVNGEKLKQLPNSKKNLPNLLDRSYGINKVYELESFKNVTKITTYYVNKSDNYLYYTPVTLVTNNNKEKIEVIIENLKSAPTYDTNLVSYLRTSAILENYEILENSVNLSFNNEVLSLEEDKIIEEVKYSIALSIRDSYDISETIFYVDNRLIDVHFI